MKDIVTHHSFVTNAVVLYCQIDSILKYVKFKMEENVEPGIVALDA